MTDKVDKSVLTRIAPSPTGFPHLGTIYQSLLDKAYALKNGGKFILRIEDTDRNRFVAEAESVIYSALEWFGLTPDESPENPGAYAPYRQSERFELYKKAVDELIENSSMTSAVVLKLSRKLDRLILSYYRFNSKSRIPDELSVTLKKYHVGK